MATKQHIEFLNWLKTRLIFKHKDLDQNIHKNIDIIIAEIKPKPLVIDKNKIEKICQRLYPTFEFIKDETSPFDIGYSKKEKLEIMNHVATIVKEYIGT